MTTERGQHRGATYELEYGSEKIRCEISFGSRTRLRIKVHPDLRVQVDAPSERSVEEVLAEVKKRAGWIIKQREYFGQFLPRMPEKRYVSGETWRYLGRQYRLKVAKSEEKTAKLVGRFLWVCVPDTNDHDAVRSLVLKWYREHARQVFERRLDRCFEAARRYGLAKPQIRLRKMTRRWGSCGGGSVILLNTNLVKAPTHCIDYVITHELCHTRYPRHSRDFYKLLSRLMPDWESRKRRLEQVCV